MHSLQMTGVEFSYSSLKNTSHYSYHTHNIHMFHFRDIPEGGCVSLKGTERHLRSPEMVNSIYFLEGPVLFIQAHTFTHCLTLAPT